MPQCPHCNSVISNEAAAIRTHCKCGAPIPGSTAPQAEAPVGDGTGPEAGPPAPESDFADGPEPEPSDNRSIHDAITPVGEPESAEPAGHARRRRGR